MERFTLKKSERLCSHKTLEQLFDSGESFLVFPLKVVFLKSEMPLLHPAEAAFAVSKRNFKRAVKRNLLKRRMREAYRLNKHLLYDKLTTRNSHISIMFIFVGKDILDFDKIEKAMILALKKVVGRM